MEYNKTTNTITIRKEVPGLLLCKFEHEIKSSKALLDYDGPKISPSVWKEILSFFKWTQSTAQSESQVRLYVNPHERTWRAWAFPQQARTGMSSKELDIAESPEKAAERFATWGYEPSDQWLYFGTVHHHCNCGAFQSGTDTNGTWNRDGEKDQDGLHVTIGLMNSVQHDMHARFYLNGLKFEPDMSWFWDIGQVIGLIPKDLHDKVARYQMCESSNVEFPVRWKENYMEIKRDFTPGLTTGGNVGPGAGNPPSYLNRSYANLPDYERAEYAADEILETLEQLGMTEQQIVDIITFMNELTYSEVIDIMEQWDVDAEQVQKELDWLKVHNYHRPSGRKKALAHPTEKKLQLADKPDIKPDNDDPNADGWGGCMGQ